MDSFNVVDPRLAAGRGEQYSAAYRRKKLEEELGEEEYQLPVNQRIEDSLDTEGLKVASTQEAIPESNVGFQMLQRMGWKGQGLGSKEDGITAPVGGGNEASLRLGLGKQEEDDFYTASDNIQRKRLEVEIQADEDETRAAMREMQAEREQRIREDVSTIKRTFYCEVCHKQYSSAAEMEVHLSSYDHHHKKRLVEMRSAENERTRKGRDKREKRRQEKEMARLEDQIQKARGGSSAQPPLPEGTSVPLPEDDVVPPLPPDYPPPPPPIEDSGSGRAVQFNMSKMSKRTAGQGAPAGGVSLGVRKPMLQKKGVKLKSKVAAFAMDSDGEG